MRIFRNISFLLLLFIFSAEVNAQENPPIPVQVEVRTSRNLEFGSFTVGTNGGTVTVNSDNITTHTGDILLLNMGSSRSAALFDVTANPGTIIQINAPTNVELTGTNGGRIYLDINSFSTGRTFITTASPPNVNEVFVGGTLRINDQASAEPGKYNGNFTLTFIHQ